MLLTQVERDPISLTITPTPTNVKQDDLNPVIHITEGGVELTAIELTAIESEEHDAAALLTELTREAHQYHPRVFHVVAILALYLALAISLKSIVSSAVWERIQDWSQTPVHLIVSVILSLSMGGCAIAANPITALERRRRRRSLASHVANGSNVRSIGALVDALKIDDARTRDIALTALINLLPRVTEADVGCVTPIQRAKLYRILNTPVENVLHKDIRALFRPAADQAVALRVAIIQALLFIGDDQALPIVRRLAGDRPKTDGESKIREAAGQCLPVLDSILQQRRVSQTLLRPSAVSSDSKNTLLRADVNEGEHDPQELLRVGQ
jgi:hypothetical protein